MCSAVVALAVRSSGVARGRSRSHHAGLAMVFTNSDQAGQHDHRCNNHVNSDCWNKTKPTISPVPETFQTATETCFPTLRSGMRPLCSLASRLSSSSRPLTSLAASTAGCSADLARFYLRLLLHPRHMSLIRPSTIFSARPDQLQSHLLPPSPSSSPSHRLSANASSPLPPSSWVVP